MTRCLLLALLVGAALAWPAAAGASRTQETILEDDHELVGRGAAARESALDDMRALGADTVRLLVQWQLVAPGAASPTKPAGFDSATPASYPASAWDPYDDVVRGAAARGLQVLFSPSPGVPRWGSRCSKPPARFARACRPDPVEFGLFVRALGVRYSGVYADENQGGGVLPRVARWSLGNEPNQPRWLYPQTSRTGGRNVMVAAVLYRRLARAGITALKATGHGDDQTLLGETAPIGQVTGNLASRPTPPATFLRALFCLDVTGRRMSGGLAKAHDCGSYRRLAVDGFAHHPYTVGGSQPPTARSSANEITIASVGRLKALLDRAGATGRVPRRLPIFYTEFGFQTDPPDSLFGVSLSSQAAYLNQADWIAYRDARIRSVAQYKLLDDAGTGTSGFQSGVRFLSGEPKPAYKAFRLPIWVTRAGGRTRVFGQLRPAVDASAEQVAVQVRSGRRWTTARTVTVRSRKGIFLTQLRRSAQLWRLRWTPAGSTEVLVSRAARVSPR